MGLGAVALGLQSEGLALVVVFLMGVHSTVFGPMKYAILPQHLEPDEPLLGTGLVEGATFVAILLGQIAGLLLPPGIAGWVALGVAVTGWLSARLIPPAPPQPGNRIDWNPWRASRIALGRRSDNPQVRIATIAISWFWALGAVYTSQFVPLAKNDLGGDEGVATLFLAAFSVGVALGSAMVSRLLNHRVSARLAVPAGIVMALAGIDLFFAERAFGGAAGDVRGFLADPRGWRVLADLTVLSVAGGFFRCRFMAFCRRRRRPAGGRGRLPPTTSSTRPFR